MRMGRYNDSRPILPVMVRLAVCRFGPGSGSGSRGTKGCNNATPAATRHDDVLGWYSLSKSQGDSLWLGLVVATPEPGGGEVKSDHNNVLWMRENLVIATYRQNYAEG